MSKALINLSRLAAVTDLRYNSDFFLLHSDQCQWEQDKPYWLNEYVIVIVAERGSVSMAINGIEHTNNTDAGVWYLLCGDNFVVHSVSDDFAGRYIIMSADFLVRLSLNSDLTLAYELHEKPFLPMSGEALQGVLNAYNMFAGILRTPNNPHIFKILQHLTQAYFLTYDYYLHSQQAITSVSREQELTQSFLHQVGFHYKQEHSVNYYAGLLHVTAKHLSRCVLHTTGMSAKQFIAKRLLSSAQSMLASGQKTVVEVSIELGFPDPSTFGKFFRQQTDMTPKAWCERCKA